MPLELLNFDYYLFRLLNSSAGAWLSLDYLIIFSATGILFLLFAGLALFALQNKNDRSRAIIAVQALCAAGIGYAAIIPIRIFFFRLRPFVAYEVTQLIAHNPLEGSFPSGHATAMFAMAFTLMYANKNWGAAALAAAATGSMARVMAGVHYPLDILGGALLGALAAIIMQKLKIFLLNKKRTPE